MPRQQDVEKTTDNLGYTRGKREVQPSRTESQPDFDVTIGTLNSRKRHQPPNENAGKN